MPTTHSINPYNDTVVYQHEYLNKTDINYKLDKAKTAQEYWSNCSIEERCMYFQNIIKVIKENIDAYALLPTVEMGKPITQSTAELEKCIWALEYYINNVAEYLASQNVATQHKYSKIHYEPLGIVLAIMPWNFPYWQVFRAMGPILLSGNTMLLKHASNVTQCAIAIEDILKKAGLPDGVFQTLVMASADVATVIANPYVQAITFTGSTDVGKIIAQTAGKHIKKQVLELGGSDAYIVAADADLPSAATALVQSRLNNAGQSCIGAKRFIFEESIYDTMLTLIQKEMDTYIMGDPNNKETTLGPLYSKQAQKDLHEQVQTAIQNGAALIKGGIIPSEVGAFYPPTILTNINKDNPAYSQEFFGPVALVFKAKTLEDAITIANDTPFGLGGGIFIGDENLGINIASKKLKAGSVAVNACVSSDPRMPFGGIKESGYGRELHQMGMLEFVNIKSVVAS